jgi:hypothetical protein
VQNSTNTNRIKIDIIRKKELIDGSILIISRQTKLKTSTFLTITYYFSAEISITNEFCFQVNRASDLSIDLGNLIKEYPLIF